MISEKANKLHIIIFAHPEFIGSKSMNRYAQQLADGLGSLGHQTEIWKPKAILNRLPGNKFSKKWMGYVDSFILFPLFIFLKIKRLESLQNTIFVFSDQALGPWVTRVRKYNHIVHCHDFLALQSALDEFPQNPTSSSGKLYQKFIRKGFTQAKNFISVSNKTKTDLEKYLASKVNISEVVYNGLNPNFKALDILQSRNEIGQLLGIDCDDGFIMHIGASVWYKNKLGVLHLYEHWRENSKLVLPLLMIGDTPENDVLEGIQNSRYKEDIFLLKGLQDAEINAAYSAASLLLFPSLAEGFGWPIIEAMACRTFVITTDASPMTEVGSDSAFYLPLMPADQNAINTWANDSAKVIESVLNMQTDERTKRLDRAELYTQNFELGKTMRKIESIYLNIVNDKTN